MGTTIRVSDETKSMLAVLKRDEETWDDLLARLARQERDVDAIGGFADEGIVEGMAQASRDVSESFETRLPDHEEP